MRAVQASLLALLLIFVAVAPAVAADGNGYFLNNSLQGGNADLEFSYGRDDDQVLVGDWDGNGTDTLGVRRGATYYLSNTFKGGNADETFTYGRTNDEVFVGDWDGDGVDTLAVRRGRTFYVSYELRGGNADAVFDYGRLGDIVLVGDWNGDGRDTFGVRRGATYYLNNALRGGNADETFTYGRAGDLVYVGDWDGDGEDTLGVRRGATYYLNNTLRGGNADVVFTYGRTNDITLVGDWDGDGDHTLGVRRATSIEPAPDATIQECLESKTSAENVAQCFAAAVAADDYDAAADVASASVISDLQDLLQYGDGSLDFGSFNGCGEPLLGYPSTGVSCFFYDSGGSDIHGVTTELLMGQQGGQFFVEAIEFIG